MACASAAVVAAASSGLQVCDASSRTSTSSVSLKAPLGHVRCMPRAFCLNESVKKVRAWVSCLGFALRVFRELRSCQHSYACVLFSVGSISNVSFSSFPHFYMISCAGAFVFVVRFCSVHPIPRVWQLGFGRLNRENLCTEILLSDCFDRNQLDVFECGVVLWTLLLSKKWTTLSSSGHLQSSHLIVKSLCGAGPGLRRKTECIRRSEENPTNPGASCG